MVFRVYVEKKPGFDIEARQLCSELQTMLGISSLIAVRILNRYDVEGVAKELFDACVPTVFSEPQSDLVSYELPQVEAQKLLVVEYLPGQFDQRADSASECVQLISQGERPVVRSAKVYVFEGDLSGQDICALKHYLINPIEARKASVDLPETLQQALPVVDKVEVLDGFLNLDDEGLKNLIADRGLAMDLADIQFCQRYFSEEKRNPTLAEIKIIDTYWSDHCRHTTFGTELENFDIQDAAVRKAFETYLNLRHELKRDEKPLCLMDMGTIGARSLKARGILKNLDESEEINACTVKTKVDVNGEEEDWLYLFKNETHNHPTEIEPFGGAATCVGGAIRDPLSGRSYVYQAMRVTGAANPLVPLSETIEGKLPQRKLVTTAAAGYSSYGNQIGLATSQVNELYHPGYAAKRMEIGAVVGATPASHVRRETPAPGDVVVLLGGRTGRDGIGGATGSSKAHNLDSLETCGAEVQKGNAPVERKIQRLFRRGEVCRLIKRCNDFGAGGVSVAVGELADGLFIDLNKIPKKYDGLNGTELALSESQERMAVALAPRDVAAFLAYAQEENIEATPIAEVTEEARVRMVFNGETVADISREFLASNGAAKHQDVKVMPGEKYENSWDAPSFAERMHKVVTDLNICSNKGLSERFDSTIGAATVLMPFGGKEQLTPSMAMVAKFPVEGETTTCSGMAWGFNPYLSESNQYVGAYLAVVESMAKLIAAGFERKRAYLTFQEYFERLRNDPVRWGKPVASVLGALMAQLDLEVGAIGGKDSMSGSFENLDVPPTLVSFATAVGFVERVTSPEFKAAHNRIVRISPRYKDDGMTPIASSLIETFNLVESLIAKKQALAVSTSGYGAQAEALFKMCLGNHLGVKLDDSLKLASLFEPSYGSFIVEVSQDFDSDNCPLETSVELLGETTSDYLLVTSGETIDLVQLQEAWEKPLESVFPYRKTGEEVPTISFEGATPLVYNGKIARPRVIIPVFPGNNCEYDSARAFKRAGAEVDTFVINNMTPDAVVESTNELAKRIKQSQIVMLPGGFSGGDEPDGSAKFITAFFRAPQVCEAVSNLLQNRDGLMLGICNGFQALIKLGLVPYGEIRPMDDTCPTLTFNEIGRHQSRLVRTRISSTLSPWLSRMQVGDIHTVAISHGEGRFVASPELLQSMAEQGQIGAQYVDERGVPSLDQSVNPNGSNWSIECITSPDGRVLGKMGHTERSGFGLYKNVPGNLYQSLFEGGVGYFTD